MGVYVTVYKNSVRTSQETHYVSATETNRLMLFTVTVAVYCENHAENEYIVRAKYRVIWKSQKVVNIVTTMFSRVSYVMKCLSCRV
jgi:hypothetical protein